MRYRVVFTDPEQHEFEVALIAQLVEQSAHFEVVDCRSETEAVRSCRTADAIVTSAAKISASVIEQLEKCCIIARVGTGFDNIDVVAAARRNIPVTNVPGFSTEDVATHTIALLLALHRRIPALDDEVHRGVWKQNNVLPAPRLSTQVLGIIGFGAIGEAVGVRAAALGMKVLYFDVADRNRPDGIGIRCRTMEALLENSDFVSVHVPLTSKTAGLINQSALQFMKPSAVLINTARGAIVDEVALVEALRAGSIAGAALDVLQNEPPATNDPLLALPNVIVTPHCASHSDNSLKELRRRAIEEVLRALRNEPLRHIVNGVGIQCTNSV